MISICKIYLLTFLLSPFGIVRLGNSGYPFTTERGVSSFSVSRFHNSPMLTRFLGSILYCKLYKFRRWIGGTNRPDTKQSRTLGEK
jgi:hypothetical protein